MNFCTVDFILFCIILAVLYYSVIPARRWMVLLAGSLIFFAVSGWKYLLYAIVLSILFFHAANRIEQFHQIQAQSGGKKCGKERYFGTSKKILIATIVIAVGNLIFNKYFNLAQDLLRNLYAYLGGTGNIRVWELALPLGLSYYTFSGLGYVLDVYWKRYPSQKNYAKFLLYIIYFPHIIQGPIERYNLLGGQFFDESAVRFQSGSIKRAFVWMGFGYFKKLFVADRIAIFVNGVLAKPDHTPGSMQLFAILLSGVWIYADFSGYIDIAKGVSSAFGIELNQNFNHPLLSKSVPEWWRRWHISLSSWWKDYIYIPLAISPGFLSLCKKIRKNYGKGMGKLFKDAAPLLLIWITTGLWHGTGSTYLAWGIYYFLLFLCSITCSPWMTKLVKTLHINIESKSFHICQMFRTYLLFCIGRLLTLPESLEYTWRILGNICTNFNLQAVFQRNTYQRYGTCPEETVFILFGIAVIIIADCIEEYNKITICEWIFERKYFVRSIIYTAVILAVLIFGIYGVDYSLDGFAYQDF